MSVKHISDGVSRLCNDTTQYGYVSDEVYRTWEECPVCFDNIKRVTPTSEPSEPVVKEVKKGLYLRGALNG